MSLIEREALENGVSWLPITPAFRARRDEFLFYDRRAHLAAPGYRRVAESIATWVELAPAPASPLQH